PPNALGVSAARTRTAKLSPITQGQNVNVGGNGKPPRNCRMRSVCGLYQARKSCVASSITCRARARVAATHAQPKAGVAMSIIIQLVSPSKYRITDNFVGYPAY